VNNIPSQVRHCAVTTKNHYQFLAEIERFLSMLQS